MSIDITDEQRTVIGRVEKMLKLAASNPNQHEAEAASKKAMELLAAYNLDMATIEREGGQDGKREDTKVKGGLYNWQRDLWRRVAELNFCYYFTLNQWDPEKKRRVKIKYGDEGYVRGENRTKVIKGGYMFEHRLVGRVVNTRSAIAMAQYLEQTIERLTRERFPDPTQFFTQPAIVYREGMADEVEGKLRAARREALKEEKRKQDEAYELAKTQGTVPPGFQMTLASMTTQEKEKNDDFLYGEGYTARLKADMVAEAEKRRIAREEHAKWAEANPEEAARVAKEEEEASRKYWSKRRGGGVGSRGGMSASEKRQDRYGSYYRAGQDKGSSISLHRQADRRGPAGLLK